MSTNQQSRQGHRVSTPWARAGRWANAAWWVMLLTGIAWLIIAVIILRFTTASVVTVGVLMGVVFLGAMAAEFAISYVRESWRWAHILLGLVFLAGAIWCFVHPFHAFWALAFVVGLLLILQGAFTLIGSNVSRGVNDAWWLGAVAGVLEILIGFWATQQLFPYRAALLIIWVGFLALFRGINDIVIAFELRSARNKLRSPGDQLRSAEDKLKSAGDQFKGPGDEVRGAQHS